MVKKLGVLGLGLCLCLALAMSLASAQERTQIGGVLLFPDNSRTVDKASASVGLEFPQHSMLKVGTEFTAKVLAPQKLKSLGLPGLKQGDTVRVKILGRDGIRIVHGNSSVSVLFDQSGAIRQTGMP